jgi:hypothetical protein
MVFLRADHDSKGTSAGTTEGRPVGEGLETSVVAGAARGVPAKGSLVIGAKVLEGERTYLPSTSSRSSSSESTAPNTGASLEELLRLGFKDVLSPEAVGVIAVKPILAVAPSQGRCRS